MFFISIYCDGIETLKRLFVKHPDTSVRNSLESDSLQIMKYSLYSCIVVLYSTVACNM